MSDFGALLMMIEEPASVICHLISVFRPASAI
jgi:hypothetical protein